MKIKPFRFQVAKVAKLLSVHGFRTVDGSDSGWFGDGVYILGNGRQLIRLTRSRNEEFVDIAFVLHPASEDWFGVAELMVATGDLTFDDAVSGRVVPHDLDFKVQALLRVLPHIETQLGPDPAHHAKLRDVRQQAAAYARRKYGSQSS